MRVLMICIFFFLGGAGGMLMLKLVEKGMESLGNALDNKMKINYETLRDIYEENTSLEKSIDGLKEKSEGLQKKIDALEAKLLQNIS